MSKPIEYGRPWWEVMKEVSEENARLKAEVERLRAASFVTAVPVEEYERLRKAGDAMADWIDNVQHDDYGWPFSDAWNAAKKGKPTK